MPCRSTVVEAMFSPQQFQSLFTQLGPEKVTQMLASGGMPEEWLGEALRYLARRRRARGQEGRSPA